MREPLRGSAERLDRAVAAVRRAEAVIVFDEGMPSTAVLVASANASSEAQATLARFARGRPALVVGSAAGGRESAGFPELDRRVCAAHGVLERAGLDEAAVDIMRLAGQALLAVSVRLALQGGVLAGDDALAAAAEASGLPIVSIQDVVAHRLDAETIVDEAAAAILPTVYAARPLDVHAFRSRLDGQEFLALAGAPLGPVPLVRLHSECLTGDALGSLRCDCGDQLRASLRMIGEDPQGGLVIYLRGHEGRGIGLANKIRAYALQDRGLDTVQANTELGFAPDLRDYGVAVQILRALGVARLRLLSNNPAKASALGRYGIEVAERLPLRVGVNPHNIGYLETKRLKLGHDFGMREPATEAAKG